MPDATLSRLINAAVAAQQRGVPPAVLGACAAILEASASGGPSDSDAGSAASASPLRGEHLLPVVGSSVSLDAISSDLGKAIRKWLGRHPPAEAVKEARLWYAQRGLVEPPAKTIEALVASVQAKREVKRSAALKAWERKSPKEREEWISNLGRRPQLGAKKAKPKR